ncbi:MAG: nucleotidyltransferase [Bacteroidales bacterium]|nr:nucleotidyltransferase [Bacteroidales bacterium]
MKLITEDKKAQLDDLLNRICESLQLNKSRREKVEERYKAVSSWIEKDDGSFHNAKIYSQGSYRIGTTVKPRNNEEYDLDFVIQTDCNWHNIIFQDFLTELLNRVKKNENYRDITIEKTRCIRVNYADEFHMDIIPTCTQNFYGDQNEIMVPDKDERTWSESNPEGYAKWFESKYIDTQKIYLREYYSGLLMEKAEDLPEEVPYELKQPLQRAVQLIKRYRDIYFEDNPELAPSSIVLTTICGMLYDQSESIVKSLDGIINRLRFRFNNEWMHKRIVITNPVKPEEDFTKAWEDKPELQRAFIKFISDLGDFWSKISEYNIHDMPNLLKSRFGESSVENAFESQADFVLEARKRGLAAISTLSGMAVSKENERSHPDKSNTFYGS